MFDVFEGYDMIKVGNYFIVVGIILEYVLGSVDGLNVVGQLSIQINIVFLFFFVVVFYLMGNVKIILG